MKSLTKTDVQDIIKSSQRDSLYSTKNSVYHTHNGIDSPNIKFGNIGNSNQYVVLNRVSLTPAQVKLLHSTPITLVPAPFPAMTATAARSVWIVEGIVAYLNYGGTAYTGTNALEFRYTDASGVKVTADISTTFLNSSSSTYSSVAGVTTEIVPVSNAPIVVSVPTANPAAGNSPITFIIKYRLVSF